MYVAPPSVDSLVFARMEQRGVVALITDGVIRDIAGVKSTGLPVWCQGTSSASASQVADD